MTDEKRTYLAYTYLVSLSRDSGFDEAREARPATVSAVSRQTTNVWDLTSGDSSDSIVLQTLWQRYTKY